MAGAAAGLGVAMPLGAVGVLLIQQGMRERRGAVAAAAAVAVVDCAYAAVATALGPLVASALSGVEVWVRLVSATVLAVIAVRGLLASRRPGPAVASEGEGTGTGAVRTFTRFAAITLINPTTALYFAALTAYTATSPYPIRKVHARAVSEIRVPANPLAATSSCCQPNEARNTAPTKTAPAAPVLRVAP